MKNVIPLKAPVDKGYTANVIFRKLLMCTANFWAKHFQP